MKNTVYNRKAGFNYIIDEKYDAGIILSGNEVKSVKENQINFNDSYCLFVNEELWLRGFFISENKFGKKENPTRDRKILLKKKELRKIHDKTKEKGFTIVPTKIYQNSKGIIKIEIGIGKGKNQYDKRETIKKRDIERELNAQRSL